MKWFLVVVTIHFAGSSGPETISGRSEVNVIGWYHSLPECQAWSNEQPMMTATQTDQRVCVPVLFSDRQCPASSVRLER